MLTMTLFLMGLLLAVGFMVHTARRTGRENRHQRRHRSAGFLGGTPFIGTGEIGNGADYSDSGSGWDGGGGWGGGGDSGGGGGS